MSQIFDRHKSDVEQLKNIHYQRELQIYMCEHCDYKLKEYCL